ncbi:uncharacterized protein A4U43_C04F8860 [Asparagus officinalis]|uniref:Uncharacterized protein n=1 Tax=Asparagus officinalis TaxID=4686 RepID=A0A5P1F223_ASPOF|nr:uncharacterized protein A4U43_C04F8860 [Asparagus officinalis]
MNLFVHGFRFVEFCNPNSSKIKCVGENNSCEFINGITGEKILNEPIGRFLNPSIHLHFHLRSSTVDEPKNERNWLRVSASDPTATRLGVTRIESGERTKLEPLVTTWRLRENPYHICNSCLVSRLIHRFAPIRLSLNIDRSKWIVHAAHFGPPSETEIL